MTGPSPLRIGTRGSALALIQAGIVRDALGRAGVRAGIDVIVTAGDTRATDTPWGEGAFVSAIEAALLDGRIDVAVHSAKDVPTDEDRRTTIGAFLPRADPRDVVVLPGERRLASLDELPAGIRVGTDSPRRGAFLRAARPDLLVQPLHGNVDTRLTRLDAGEADALVLAAAGLQRLGRHDRVSFVLDPESVPPAPGQGALAVQVRSDDHATLDRVGVLDDPATRRAVEAERAILAASGGGCRAPLGALGHIENGELELVCGYARDGSDLRVVVRGRSKDGDDDALVESLIDDLALAAVAVARRSDGPRIVLTRPAGLSASTILALVDAGLVPLAVPAIAIEPVADGALDAALGELASFDWVVVASANAARAVRAAAARTGTSLAPVGASRRPRWAVVGAATERALAAAGIRATIRPGSANGRALVDAMPIRAGDRVLLPRSDQADDDLPAALRSAGAVVRCVTAYRTVESPPASGALLATALAARPAAIVFSSGSTVRGLLGLAAGHAALDAVRAIPVSCVGSRTAAVAAACGFAVSSVATGADPRGLAEAALRAVHSVSLNKESR